MNRIWWPASRRARASLTTRESWITSCETIMRTRMSSPEGLVHDPCDLLARRAVPVGVRPPTCRGHLLLDGRRNPRRLRPRQDVCADGEGLGPLRVLPQRHAGDLEVAAFLLESSGIRHHECGVLLEDEHVEVSRGLDPAQVRHLVGPLLKPEALQILRGPWVD